MQPSCERNRHLCIENVQDNHLCIGNDLATIVVMQPSCEQNRHLCIGQHDCAQAENPAVYVDLKAHGNFSTEFMKHDGQPSARWNTTDNHPLDEQTTDNHPIATDNHPIEKQITDNHPLSEAIGYFGARRQPSPLRGDDGLQYGIWPCLQEYHTGPVCIQRLIGEGNKGSGFETHSPPEPYKQTKGDVSVQPTQETTWIQRGIIFRDINRILLGVHSGMRGCLLRCRWAWPLESQNARCLKGPHPVHPGREVRMIDHRNPLATTNSLELFRNHQHYWNTERWDHDRNRHANVHPLLNVELTSEISVAASKPERIELELGPVILATNQTPQISCPEGVTSPPKCSVCEMIQCR